MAVPAPAIPTGNAYTVNVARPLGEASPLPTFAVAGAHLLRRWKIPVRMHVAGDTPALTALRLRLSEAGARPSAFSPAPSPEIPGEGFWKTTMNVVERPDVAPDKTTGLFWADERGDKKVDWDPLLIALSPHVDPAGLTTTQIAKPDLWIISAHDAGINKNCGGDDVLRAWVRAGAGAVCVVTQDEVFWHTGNAVFGQSSGSRKIIASESYTPGGDVPRDQSAGSQQTDLGVFAAGVVTGLMRDLLSENLFDKTLLRADRECLEMRPLRLSRAVLEGVAAHGAHRPGDSFKGFSERTESLRVAHLGPESRPWAHKGR